MAAHGLTIARELVWAYSQRSPEDYLRLAEHALGAPGFDVGPSDPTYGNSGFYGQIYRACKGIRRYGHAVDPSWLSEERAVQIVEAATKIAANLAFLDGYGSLEDARAAYDAFVRPGTPHYQERRKRWFAGDPKAHRTARPGSAPTFPIVRV